METFTTAAEKIPRFRVKCAGCGIDIGWDHFEQEDAVKKWNRRDAASSEGG